MTPLFPFENSYTRLPEHFYVRQAPVPVSAPAFTRTNSPLAASLGLDSTRVFSAEGLAILSGNVVAPNSEPLALAYAGHQFGHFTMLGDGRALLLGELLSPALGRVDVQLKGSGRTPFSRSGDGRAALGPMLREYIISEAMHALGIPTTRSLAVVTTGEPVMRTGPLPGAILTRVASSHLRVGTFEYAARLGDPSALTQLADYAIHRHYPEVADDPHPYRAFLAAVIDRQATMIAQWMAVGFVHGVMNTDNMSIAGETIDYGPCAFLDRYDPATVFSSIDHQGRYAFGNQPPIALWNLTRLAESLLPLLGTTQSAAVATAETLLAQFRPRFETRLRDRHRAKLGLTTTEPEDDDLIDGWLDQLQENALDYTLSFRSLGEALTGAARPEWGDWYGRWRARLAREPDALPVIQARMHRHNPAVIPRNHRVEEALAAAAAGDETVLDRLVEVLARPYTMPVDASYSEPPPAGANYRTFCGT